MLNKLPAKRTTEMPKFLLRAKVGLVKRSKSLISSQMDRWEAHKIFLY